MHRYGTYQLVQKMSGGDQLVAFTRILHRSSTDVLMNEVLPMLLPEALCDRGNLPTRLTVSAWIKKAAAQGKLAAGKTGC